MIHKLSACFHKLPGHKYDFSYLLPTCMHTLEDIKNYCRPTFSYFGTQLFYLKNRSSHQKVASTWKSWRDGEFRSRPHVGISPMSFFGQKVTRLGLSNSSVLLCEYYHLIYTWAIMVFFNNFFLDQKVTIPWLSKLSALLCLYYHASTHELSRMFFNKFFEWNSYHIRAK